VLLSLLATLRLIRPRSFEKRIYLVNNRERVRRVPLSRHRYAPASFPRRAKWRPLAGGKLMVPRSRPDRLIGSFERLERLSRNRCSSTPSSAPFLSFHPEFESARGCSSADVHLRSDRIVFEIVFWLDSARSRHRYHYESLIIRKRHRAKAKSQFPIPANSRWKSVRAHPGRAFFAIRGGAFHPALRASLKSRGKYHFPP